MKLNIESIWDCRASAVTYWLEDDCPVLTGELGEVSLGVQTSVCMFTSGSSGYVAVCLRVVGDGEYTFGVVRFLSDLRLGICGIKYPRQITCI